MHIVPVSAHWRQWKNNIHELNELDMRSLHCDHMMKMSIKHLHEHPGGMLIV